MTPIDNVRKRRLYGLAIVLRCSVARIARVVLSDMIQPNIAGRTNYYSACHMVVGVDINQDDGRFGGESQA